MSPLITILRSRLKHRATSRKVLGLIPDGVIVIFHWHNPSGRTKTLQSTQPVGEMSTKSISCGERAAGAQVWQPYHLHVPTDLKSGSLNHLETSGPVQACNGNAVPRPNRTFRADPVRISGTSVLNWL